jgi:riboflavin synthase
MFTGIIEEVGKINVIRHSAGGLLISILSRKILNDIKIDDSIAIDGVCQTVVAFDNTSFTVQTIEETLRKTTFSKLKSGNEVNLERAMRPNDRLGGHIVQGHVDCVGRVSSISAESTGINLWVEFDRKFETYLVNTGSVCLNGISLTTAKVEQSRFMVSLIPHTREKTTMKHIRVGSELNLEFDIIGKYMNRILGRNEGRNTSSLINYIDQPDL